MLDVAVLLLCKLFISVAADEDEVPPYLEVVGDQNTLLYLVLNIWDALNIHKKSPCSLSKL